jgi:hypothetical protein
MKNRISLSQWLFIIAGCLMLGFGAVRIVHASKHQGVAVLRTKEGPQEMDEGQYKAYSYTGGVTVIVIGIVFLGFGLHKRKTPETEQHGDKRGD